MVNVTIDNRRLSVPEGTTILKAAEMAGIPVPSLCYLKEISEIAACRICVVEVEGIDRLIPSCDNRVTEGMSPLGLAGRPEGPDTQRLLHAGGRLGLVGITQNGIGDQQRLLR